MTVIETEHLWYNAKNADEQDAAVAQLVSIGREAEVWTDRSRATSAIIELLHLTRHPREQIALIEALGRCRCADHEEE